MTIFYIGQHLTHPDHGPCTVTFVGSDYVGVETDGGGNALIRKQTFLEAPAAGEQAVGPVGRPLSWPESTFVHESAETQHYPGSHWEAFFDNPKLIVERLPEVLQKADPWVGGSNRKSSRPMPDRWTKGVALAWPNHRQGLMVILRIDEENKETSVSSFFPFVSDGGQYNIVIRHINVWENGVEAQIEAEFGEATITFFDISFTKNRLWYEAGKCYQFILTGIAYAAKPAEVMELPFTPNPDQVAWERKLAEQRGEGPPTRPTKISLRGMAMMMPVEEWDIDDYRFRGPVKSVKNVEGDVLGQTGWFIKVTVMRFGDADADIDMLVTRRAWQSDSPPAVGQDVEGSFWLQGYLTYPPVW